MADFENNMDTIETNETAMEPACTDVPAESTDKENKKFGATEYAILGTSAVGVGALLYGAWKLGKKVYRGIKKAVPAFKKEYRKKREEQERNRQSRDEKPEDEELEVYDETEA